MSSSSYSMSLADILVMFSIASDDDITVSSLVLDSRLATEGSLFFAYPGSVSDGRDFVLAAQEAGASAIVYEADNFEVPDAISIPAFGVYQLRNMVGFVAHEFFRQPTSEMQVFGVTGTNGKTTCCYLLTQALIQLRMPAAMIGTIGFGSIESLSKTSQTTPDPISLHKQFAAFRDQGITQVCMEVSSHALDQGRVNGVQFFCTLFTNLSHDHLDYHGNMETYAAAKRKLFTEFSSELIVTNADDAFGVSLVDTADAEFIVSYGKLGDVYAEEVTLRDAGIEMLIEGNGVEFELSTPLIGEVNVPNIEMLVATLLALSTSIEDIQNIVAKLRPAPGRMELYAGFSQPSVIVDYAHTPDALEKALLSIKEHCQGRLWCVFGCGGDRDKDKRALMGAAAEKYADKLVVTNDNPRHESAEKIADDILRGINGDVEVILDRARAISTTIEQADAKDWVLIAGKGHETTQQVKEECRDFSDRDYVRKLLEFSKVIDFDEFSESDSASEVDGFSGTDGPSGASA